MDDSSLFDSNLNYDDLIKQIDAIDLAEEHERILELDLVRKSFEQYTNKLRKYHAF